MTFWSDQPILMLVTDRARSLQPLVEAVPAAVDNGVDLVLLREPANDDLAADEIVRNLIGVVTPSRLIVSGRPEVAERYGIGLHLRDGQRLPDDHQHRPRPLGRSSHGEPDPVLNANSHSAREDGANPIATNAHLDYLLVGNVFATRTHPDRPARGLEWLMGIVDRSPVPVIAIGGITEYNAIEVLGTGCVGIAVIDAILADPNPGAAAARLRMVLDHVHQGGMT